MTVYTEKQRQLMQLWQDDQLRRVNLLEGSVSSGKTWISLVLWAFWVATMPRGKLYLMCAKSLTTLKRNCLILLQELVGQRNFTFSISAKEGYLFGRRVLFEGANDARSESKIRGMTLQGAYCDELTQFPEDFFAMLLSRLRVPGAKLIATTNPDSPGHWLKSHYIDRAEELDFLDICFTIDDNTTLDPEYVENIKREYTGVFYDRFILGKWCLAEGLVYDLSGVDYLVDTLPEGDYRYYISVDYGTLNPCSMGLWALDNAESVAYRIREDYYSGRDRRTLKTDEEYHDALETLAGDLPIEAVIVDPSAASFIETIRRHRRFSVRKAKNDILPGIRLTATLLRRGKLKILRRCEDAIREFGLYSWDDKATEDKVIKGNDHAMDDIRYFAMTILRKEFRWEEW